MTLKLELNTLLNNYDNIDDFKKEIKQKIPDIRFNESNNLLLLANKYKTNNYNISKLEKECKNIIIDKQTKKILVYLYDSILYNEDAKSFFN